ncbi:MAG: GNAT family N-acetyltransferase [Bacteroidota bacterium]
MTIQRQEEFCLSAQDHRAIEKLLAMCFPEYPKGRTYYKQIPDFRFLVWEANQLIGHLAVEHRLINVAGSIAKIFGVVDLCVDQAFQDRKIASQLLQELETLGKSNGIDFLLLAAAQHRLYQNNGFQLVNNTFRWLIINDHQTFGVGNRRIKDSMMIKALGKQQWKTGQIDLLGPVF